jgi:fructose-1-phosphate kinase PfkB-like protein
MKLVRESISNFERGKDPKATLAIGKRAQIKKWFDDLGLDESVYKIKDDLRVVVKGNLNLRNTQITELPDNLRVGEDIYKDF